MDIAAWLRGLGLEQYAPAFAENYIRPELLPELTSDDLKELGVASVGHRREILAAIAGPRAAPSGSANVSAPEATAAAAAERRELTMFCDLVGSTARSARLDPEDLRAVISAYHRWLEECCILGDPARAADAHRPLHRPRCGCRLPRLVSRHRPQVDQSDKGEHRVHPTPPQRSRRVVALRGPTPQVACGHRRGCAPSRAINKRCATLTAIPKPSAAARPPRTAS
jgi:hypothetical protein